jgi:hypothetical protein
MRQKNWRFVLAGGILITFAVGFFLVMLSMVHRSNDPEGMMRIVGEVSGGCIGLAAVFIVAGLIGKKV